MSRSLQKLLCHLGPLGPLAEGGIGVVARASRPGAGGGVGAALRRLRCEAGPGHAGSVASQQRQLASMGSPATDAGVVAKARRMALWVGSLAGVFGSFVGVGGGVLVSPVIANACRSLPQRVISGTSLAAVVVTGTCSGMVFHSHGSADPTSALVIAAAAVLTAPLGAKATRLFDCQSLRKFLGYWLYFVAPLVPLKAYLSSKPVGADAAATQDAAPASDAASAGGGGGGSDGGEAGSLLLRPLRGSDAALAATGIIAGFASGLLGIGGGSIVTPALALFTGMPQAQVVGTSLMAMVIPGLIGLATHARLGNVDWLMAAGLGAGTMLGSLTGSSIAVNAPPLLLEAIFGLGMIYLGRSTLAGAAKAGAAGALKEAALKIRSK